MDSNNKSFGRKLPNGKIELSEAGIKRFIYHATFRSNLPSIKRLGLGAKQPKNWDFSLSGDLCFSSNPDVAYSFCECAEDVSESKYNSGIVVLATPYIDGYTMLQDLNCQGEPSCFCMKGVVIPPDRLYIVTTKHNKIHLEGKLLNLKRVPAYEQ